MTNLGTAGRYSLIGEDGKVTVFAPGQDFDTTVPELNALIFPNQKVTIEFVPANARVCLDPSLPVNAAQLLSGLVNFTIDQAYWPNIFGSAAGDSVFFNLGYSVTTFEEYTSPMLSTNHWWLAVDISFDIM